MILNPRFPYAPHCNVDEIKALRRYREKMSGHQVLIRKQKERQLNLTRTAQLVTAKSAMKDLNCEFEFEILKKLRAKSNAERRLDAACYI